MKFVSLFAGIGGFDLALERLGHECVYANDFDKYCKQTYDKHFERKLDTRDVTKIRTDDIPEHDLLVGGFPCQSFSVAGKRRGFGDIRGTLFFEIARILEERQPRLLLLENVKGLLSHDQGRTFATIIRTLDELGYDCQWQVCNSKNFGVPQNRERVYIVGHTRGTRRPKVFPFTNANTKTLEYVGGILSERAKQWLDDGKYFSRNFPQGSRVYSSHGLGATLASQAGGLGAKTGLYFIDLSTQQAKITQQARTLQARYNKGYSHRQGETSGVLSIPVLTPDRLNKRQNGRRFKEDGEPSFTLTAQDKHGIYDGTRIRRLTPLECERLQGFPDGWTEGVSDTQRYKQLGNAVTVNVVYAIASYLGN